MTVLVDGPDAEVVASVDRCLDVEMPDTFAGHPVRSPTTYDPRVRHEVEVATLAGFARSRLGVDATAPMTALDWLTVTGQACSTSSALKSPHQRWSGHSALKSRATRPGRRIEASTVFFETSSPASR